ncbi:MAG TPA: twin-arginine translocase subunit TatC [Candidatus Nanopelagicales bacterium]|jgi:sec-independent protein translocase protein TatC
MTTTEDATTPPRKGRRGRRGNPDGSMSLLDHLRELQRRLFRSALAILIGAAVGWAYYTPIFDWLHRPMDPVIEQAKAEGRPITLAVTGITDAFTLQLKISLAVGLILALPVWLYQLWRFIAPGLKGNERRWAYGFAAAATPLFLGGIALGYAVMPKILEVMLGFTPATVENIISVDFYLSFVMQILLFFGFGALVPLLFVMLNFAHVLSARRFLGWWRSIIVGAFVFAAVATPTGDPVTMTLVAGPVLGLMVIAGVIMAINDGRRARRDRSVGYAQWADDETSPMPETIEDPVDSWPDASTADVTTAHQRDDTASDLAPPTPDGDDIT